MMGRSLCSKGTRNVAEPSLEWARPGAELFWETHTGRDDCRGGTNVDVQRRIGLCKRSAKWHPQRGSVKHSQVI